jgi:hypothetical protein
VGSWTHTEHMYNCVKKNFAQLAIPYSAQGMSTLQDVFVRKHMKILYSLYVGLIDSAENVLSCTPELHFSEKFLSSSAFPSVLPGQYRVNMFLQ